MSKKRYGEARLYLGGATLALLAGVWSALSAHDLSTLANQTQAAPTGASVQSQTASSQTSASNTQSSTHTRTRAS